MRIPKFLQLFCIGLMSLLLTNLPSVAFAETSLQSSTMSGMISTQAVVENLTRAEAKQNIENYLSRSDLRQKLIDHGVSPDEVSKRLATLSDSEMRQLSGQMDQARYGGDILIAILVIVLIIFLIKRI